MKNFGVERRASRESRQDPAASGTSSNGSPTEGGKKLRFSKLWVCTRRSNLPISKIGKSAPRRASDVLRGLEGIEKNGRVLSDEKSSQTYVDYSSTTDASTETIDAQFKKFVLFTTTYYHKRPKNICFLTFRSRRRAPVSRTTVQMRIASDTKY